MSSIGVIEMAIILVICALALVVIGVAVFLIVRQTRKRPDQDQG